MYCIIASEQAKNGDLTRTRHAFDLAKSFYLWIEDPFIRSSTYIILEKHIEAGDGNKLQKKIMMP